MRTGEGGGVVSFRSLLSFAHQEAVILPRPAASGKKAEMKVEDSAMGRKQNKFEAKTLIRRWLVRVPGP